MELRIEVLRYPEEMAGALPWYARVWQDRPGDTPRLLWGTGPCGTAARARGIAETYVRTRSRAVVRQVEAGRWELT